MMSKQDLVELRTLVRGRAKFVHKKNKVRGTRKEVIKRNRELYDKKGVDWMGREKSKVGGSLRKPTTVWSTLHY